MKTDIFTKIVLTAIALALAAPSLTTVHAGSLTKWEYTRINVAFRSENGSVNTYAFVQRDGLNLPGNPKPGDVMNQLGSEGWELVSDMPIVVGSTNEVLMFKRPMR